jgi:hypothetical protein
MIVFEEKTEEFLEMANFVKRQSGLPVNLWLDEGGYYKRGGHWKRVKFQNDHGEKLNYENLITMTVSDSPVIPRDEARKVKLPAREVEQIRLFVATNRELLSKLADQEIDMFEFRDQMVKV